MENQIEQKYIAALENTLQLSREIENLRDQLRSLTELCLKRSDRLNKENTKLQNQITALQKENETLRGAMREDVTKGVRAAFEVAKILSEDYLMPPPKEYPQTQMPLSELIGKGIDFKGITHISINGGRVLSAAILSIDNDKVILSIKGNIHSWNISEITVIK